jgi:hypothetical protein
MALAPSTREGSNDHGIRSSNEVLLITGSGDETVKVTFFRPFPWTDR